MDDFNPLAALRAKAFAKPMETGKYQFYIDPASIDTYSGPKTAGLKAQLVILSGPHEGKRLDIRLQESGGSAETCYRDARALFKIGDIAELGNEASSLLDILKLAAIRLDPRQSPKPSVLNGTIRVSSDPRGLPSYELLDDIGSTRPVVQPTVTVI